MKRFHVHLSVQDLDQNVRFYSSLFGVPPTVLKDDYAKWMLDDPRINFAISTRGLKPGVDHLGLQVESDSELAEMRRHVESAKLARLDQTGAECCYARADKYWIADPQKIAWETFHTLDTIPVYGRTGRADATACCAAAPAVESPAEKRGACCA